MIRTTCRSGRCSCLSLFIALACSLVISVTALGNVGAWWNDTVFCEVFVQSSYNHDASGVGDPGGTSNLTLAVELTGGFRPSSPFNPSSWSWSP